MFTPRRILEEKLRKMLAEDVGLGDVTTALIVPSESTAEAEVIAKESGVVAGIEEGKILLESLGLEVQPFVTDGERIEDKQVLMRISGDAKTILSAERTFINILSRMSGIATATKKLTEKIKKAGLKTRVACTRKTAPGLLYFDKKAVFVGGGDTHRLHLDDMVLIKDNHIAVAGSVKEAIKRVKEKVSFCKKVEVEVTKVDDVLTAAEAGVNVIMLDNFSPKQIEKTIKLLKKHGLFGKVLLEASGGITSQNILTFASTGIDIVSLGELTDSTKSLDMSLEIKS
jgi:nicotinate-nucleotide pyrophosphorylase (carboxylating)